MGLVLGILFGMLELLPNGHPQILAITVLPMLHFGFADNIMFITATLMTSMYLHTLGHTYHPIPKALLAAAEPAQKLAYKGLGKWATKIQVDGIPHAAWSALLWTPFLVGVSYLVKPLVVPVGIVLLCLAVWRAKSKGPAALVLILGVIVGMLAQVRLESHAMAPLLTGLFTMPPLWHILHQEKTLAIPKDEPIPADTIEYSGIDSLLGILGSFLPGISTSSLVHLRVNETQTKEHEYLCRSTLQNNSSDVCALLLLILLAQAHSSMSVALFSVSPKFPVVYSYSLVLGTVLLLIPVLKALTFKIEDRYIRIIQWIPQKPLAIGIGCLSSWQVLHHSHAYGIVIMIAAAGVGMLQKQFQVPNQILLQALTIPVLIQLQM